VEPLLHRRRNTKRIVGITLVAVGVFVLLLFVFRNPQAPEAGLRGARAALDAAMGAEAPRYAPEAYRLADQTFGNGWLEMARQKGRLRIFRNYTLADSLLGLATTYADAAAAAARDSASWLEAMATSKFAAFQARVDLRRSSLDNLLTDQRAEHQWSIAQSSLLVAGHLIEDGAYQDALDAIDAGMGQLDSLDAILAGYFRDENQQITAWRRWVQETLSASRRQGRYAVIVDKSAHSLYLVRNGALLKTYPCELGRNPAYQKQYAGDGATPEGEYAVTKVKSRESKYYKALLLDYPNSHDRARFAHSKVNGDVPSGAGPGGYIEIHGMGGRGLDWTDGCIALRNEDMDAVLKYVGVGTPVTIVRKSDQWP
jgi:hypothetical protein